MYFKKKKKSALSIGPLIITKELYTDIFCNFLFKLLINFIMYNFGCGHLYILLEDEVYQGWEEWGYRTVPLYFKYIQLYSYDWYNIKIKLKK